MQSRGVTHICLFQCWKKYEDIDEFCMKIWCFSCFGCKTVERMVERVNTIKVGETN